MDETKYVRGTYNATIPFYMWHKVSHIYSGDGGIHTACGLVYRMVADMTTKEGLGRGDRCHTRACFGQEVNDA